MFVGLKFMLQKLCQNLCSKCQSNSVQKSARLVPYRFFARKSNSFRHGWNDFRFDSCVHFRRQLEIRRQVSTMTDGRELNDNETRYLCQQVRNEP